MKVNSQLERAQFENVASNPAAATAGRFFWNTTDGKAYLDDGTAIRSLLRNDGNAVFGNNGTAANNIRFHRGANGVLQLVSGADTTAEGTLSTALNQISSRQENYSAGTLPAFGNQGRLAYVTDTGFLNVDNGSAWKVLVDTNTAQTITGKTITSSSLTDATITNAAIFTQIATPANPSAGFNKLYVKADGKFYTLDSAGNEASIGSGGGGGGGAKNLITNGSADDTASSIFVPYADAAGTRPVDGTGGSPTVTTSVTTTNPLDGTKAFLLTKPASNVQGQGWAVPFAVDPAYRAKSLKISADYIINSGTFVPGSNGGSPTDGDLIWYIYDVTNSQLIEPSNIKMFSSDTGISDKFEATFQTSVSGASYRLIAHVASTSALAFEIKLDNVTVSPQVYVYGTPIIDEQAFTPATSQGFGTLSGVALYQSKIGDSVKVSGRITLGTTTAVEARLDLPPGMVIKSGISNRNIGTFGRSGAGTNKGGFILGSGGNSYITFTTADVIGASAADPTLNANGTGIGGTGEVLFIEFMVPIQGLSSSVQMSDQVDTRVVSFVGIGLATTQALTAGVTDISFTASKDTHVGWSTNQYRVSVAGDYYVSAFCYTASGTPAALVYVNGVSINKYLATFTTTGGGGSVIVPNLKVGDLLSLRLNASVTLAADTAQNISISRIAGPQAIATSEDINMRAVATSGQTFANATAVTISYPTVTKDTHGGWNGTQYKAPIAGVYRVNFRLQTDMITSTSTNYMQLYKNVSTFVSEKELPFDYKYATTYEIIDDVYLLAGETIECKHFQGTGSTRTAITATGRNAVSISRVGN